MIKTVLKVMNVYVNQIRVLTCEPFVFGPEFALDKIPAPVCFNSGKISSWNFPPNIDSPPLPVPVGSPPCIMKSLIILSEYVKHEVKRVSMRMNNQSSQQTYRLRQIISINLHERKQTQFAYTAYTCERQSHHSNLLNNTWSEWKKFQKCIL